MLHAHLSSTQLRPLFLMIAATSVGDAFAMIEVPAYDLFGADQKITVRSQRLTPDRCGIDIGQSGSISLQDSMNLALCNNPKTRSRWFSLRATAASTSSSKAELLLPDIRADASLNANRITYREGSSTSRNSSAGLTLGYTLFDFGRKQAALEAAEESLLASALEFDAEMQSMISRVIEAYYRTLTAEASLQASYDTFQFAKSSMEAARTRYSLGLVPKSDVLQAMATYSANELAVQNAENAMKLTRANLLNLMGLALDTDVALQDIDDSQLARSTLDADLNQLTEHAMHDRVDLAAQKARLNSGRANLEALKRANMPRVSLTAQHHYDDIDIFNSRTPLSNAIGITVSIPIFSGFTRAYNVRSAEDDLRSQELQHEASKRDVEEDVFRSHTNYRTADQAWMVSWDYLSSATELRDISLARYREGVGSMLDVLNANSQYASATDRLIQARLNLLLTRADLVRSIGIMNLDTAQHSDTDPSRPKPRL